MIRIEKFSMKIKLKMNFFYFYNLLDIIALIFKVLLKKKLKRNNFQ